MQNTPIVLSHNETMECLKISNLSDMELTRKQWELLGRLTGSILMQVRECFIEHQHADTVSISVKASKELYSVKDVSKHVPFFKHRI